MFKTIKAKIDNLCIKAYCTVDNFRTNQEGDTNFISIMIILGVVVVFAGLFATLGEEVIKNVQNSIKDFLDSLG